MRWPRGSPGCLRADSEYSAEYTSGRQPGFRGRKSGWRQDGGTIPRLPTPDSSGTRLRRGAITVQRRLQLEIAMDGWPIEREVRRGIDGSWRNVGRHAVEKLVGVFATQDELAVLVSGESLMNLGIDHGQQIVPETGNVEQHTWLGV